MGQFGAQRMGGVALSAGGTVPQVFNTMPAGHIARLYLEIDFKLKSTGSSFTLSVSTAGSAASETTDDMDILLNLLFSSLSLYWNAEQAAFTGLTPARLRTVLGLMNQRDFAGTMTNGATVPASGGTAAAFSVVVCIPLTLINYFQDGNIFGAGSQALKDGRIEYTAGSTLTPNATLANGTAAVTALAVSLVAEEGAGSENDLGNLWNAQNISSVPTVWDFDDALRVALLDTSPVSTNAVSAYNVGPFSLVTPAIFGSKYQQERLTAGGYDVTARCTPLIWIEPQRQFAEFEALLGRALHIDAVSGVNSLSLVDIRMIPPSPVTIQKVAQRAGAGGPVTVSHPTPKSLPAGSSVSASLTALLPARVTPGGPTPGARGTQAPRATPAAVASATAQRGAFMNRIGSLLRVNRGS